MQKWIADLEANEGINDELREPDDVKPLLTVMVSRGFCFWASLWTSVKKYFNLDNLP